MQTRETLGLLREQFRDYLTARLEPLTSRLEAGEELPYPFMRRMVADLGLADDMNHFTTEEAELAREAHTLLMVEIARINPGFGPSYGTSMDLCAGNLAKLGTSAQIERYLPDLRRADKIGAWCLTEPQAGSDAFRSMRAAARRSGDEFVLNGTKTFITNGPHAHVFLVYAREDTSGSIQGFIVERDFEGVSTSPPFEKMGMKSSPTGQVFFDDVRIPKDNLLGLGIGDRDHVRKSLVDERVGIAALSYGIAERCFEIARDYALDRHLKSGQASTPQNRAKGSPGRVLL